MGRPIARLKGTGRCCPMGRETGLEKVIWRDGWLWLEAGGMVARKVVPSPVVVEPLAAVPVVREFGGALPEEFQWLRTPLHDLIFRKEEDALVMIGRESMGSWFEQALGARRQEHHVYRAETVVALDPVINQQAAGLTTHYNRHKFHAARVTHVDVLGRVVTVPDASVISDEGGQGEHASFTGAVVGWWRLM